MTSITVFKSIISSLDTGLEALKTLSKTNTTVKVIGAAWKRTSKEGSEYLSVSIDDISFTTKAYCRLVKTGAEKGHTLFWERPRPSYEQE